MGKRGSEVRWGGDREFDVAIIGAGILGAATAYYLSKEGYRVAVFEQGDVNRQGSGTTAGNLHIQAIHPRRPGQSVSADIGRFLPLQIAACELWEHIEDELGQSLELNRQGGLMVAETSDQVRELRAKHAMERAAGLWTEVISGDEARKLLPDLSPTVLAADWCPRDGYANPLLATPAYLGRAEEQGAQVFAFTRVDGIDLDSSGYAIRAGLEGWHAKHVVNVAGPWIRKVALLTGVDIAIIPVAIQMHVTRRVPPLMRILVQHVGEALSVKQVAAGNILVGGGWPAKELRLDHRSVASVASMQANLRQAGRVLPFLKGMELLRVWAGPLAATADEMPIVGAVPGLRNYFVAGGTYAFTLAPLWGQCLCDLVGGRQPLVSLQDLGPGRLLRVRVTGAT